MTPIEIIAITTLLINTIGIFIVIKKFIWDSKRQRNEEKSEIENRIIREHIKDNEIDDKILNAINEQYNHCKVLKDYDLKDQKKFEESIEKQLFKQCKDIEGIQNKLHILSDEIIKMATEMKNLTVIIQKLESKK